MNKVRIAQIIFIMVIIATIFYNLGVSYVIKHQEISKAPNGYEVTIFDNVFYYETEE